MSQPPHPKLTPTTKPERRDAIIEAIAEYDLANSAAWSNLDELSSQTILDSIEANPEGIFDAGDGLFEATATVYVELHYGDKKDSFSTTDSFPAHVTGSAGADNQVQINTFTVDTSSFYDIGDEEPGADQAEADDPSGPEDDII